MCIGNHVCLIFLSDLKIPCDIIKGSRGAVKIIKNDFYKTSGR